MPILIQRPKGPTSMRDAAEGEMPPPSPGGAMYQNATRPKTRLQQMFEGADAQDQSFAHLLQQNLAPAQPMRPAVNPAQPAPVAAPAVVPTPAPAAFTPQAAPNPTPTPSGVGVINRIPRILSGDVNIDTQSASPTTLPQSVPLAQPAAPSVAPEPTAPSPGILEARKMAEEFRNPTDPLISGIEQDTRGILGRINQSQAMTEQRTTGVPNPALLVDPAKPYATPDQVRSLGLTYAPAGVRTTDNRDFVNGSEGFAKTEINPQKSALLLDANKYGVRPQVEAILAKYPGAGVQDNRAADASAAIEQAKNDVAKRQAMAATANVTPYDRSRIAVNQARENLVNQQATQVGQPRPMHQEQLDLMRAQASHINQMAQNPRIQQDPALRAKIDRVRLLQKGFEQAMFSGSMTPDELKSYGQMIQGEIDGINPAAAAVTPAGVPPVAPQPAPGVAPTPPVEATAPQGAVARKRRADGGYDYKMADGTIVSR